MLRYILAFMMIPAAAASVTFDLPGRPKLIREIIDPNQTLVLPISPNATTGAPPEMLTGLRVKRALRSEGQINVTTTAQKLVQQLVDDGYTILLNCDQNTCGGFQFRFAQDIIPPPDMFVDLGNYAYISAIKENTKGAALLISSTRTAAYFHISTVNENADIITTPELAPLVSQGSIAHTMQTTGKAVLVDLAFKSGAAELETIEYASLMELAEYMSANPQVAIALVGHTDATGRLEANIALSQRRARTVRDALASRYGIDPSRMVARGVGYLAPLTTNATADGRRQNRRVEAVITTTGND